MLTFKNRRTNKATPISDTIGTLAASFAKLSIFQPADTVATNAMMGKENLSKFKQEVSRASWYERFRLFYSGSTIELMKKLPSNSYRYPMQRAANAYMDQHYHDKFSAFFGNHATAAQGAVAGGITAMFEPCITQPFDTIMVHQQVHHSTILNTMRTLSFRDCYRVAPVTGIFRNLPSGVTLFGGSEEFNHLLRNDNKESNMLNVASKVGAGFASSLVSQPGDVLKVNMQTNRWTFMQALRNIPARQFFSNGLQFRLIGGAKAGVGYFMVEKAMAISADLFGKEPLSNDTLPQNVSPRSNGR